MTTEYLAMKLVRVFATIYALISLSQQLHDHPNRKANDFGAFFFMQIQHAVFL
jgi:hypothetical protein